MMLDDFARLSDRVPDWASAGFLTLMFGTLLCWQPGLGTGFCFALTALLLAETLHHPGMPSGPD